MTMRTVRRVVLSSALLLGMTLPASAQEQTWAQKMFEKEKIDFGVIARGADAKYRLKITNLYKQDVHISNVRTTCGCSAATPSQTTLKSREEAYVEVTMDTRRFSRRKDSNVIVTFDQPLYEEVRIPITAYIRTDVVVEPGAAKYGAIDQGTSQQKSLSISYAGRDDWKIKEVRANGEYVTAEVVETSRAAGRVTYNLNVTLSPSTPAGEFRDQVILVTDDENAPYVPILVEARVEADITVTPSVVSLGILSPGQVKTANVVVRGKKAFEIAKVECGPDAPEFQVKLPNAAKPVHVLPIAVTSPTEKGTFTETITVTIPGRPEPVTFKVYGEVAGE